jgi:hypothetical protein
MHRQQLVQLGARKGLLGRVEIDPRDAATFIICGDGFRNVLSQRERRKRDANQQRGEQWHRRTHDSQ